MKHSFGLKLIAFLMFAGVGLLVLGSLSFLKWGALEGTTGTGGPMYQLFADLGKVGAEVFLALAGAYVVLAICILRFVSWARPVTIAFIAVGLLFAGVGILISLPRPDTAVCAWQLFVIGIDAWIIWYLTRPLVKDAFKAAEHGRVLHSGYQNATKAN